MRLIGREHWASPKPMIVNIGHVINLAVMLLPSSRIVEMKSENEDEDEVESMPVRSLPEGDDWPTEPAEQDASEQPI